MRAFAIPLLLIVISLGMINIQPHPPQMDATQNSQSPLQEIQPLANSTKTVYDTSTKTTTTTTSNLVVRNINDFQTAIQKNWLLITLIVLASLLILKSYFIIKPRK